MIKFLKFHVLPYAFSDIFHHGNAFLSFPTTLLIGIKLYSVFCLHSIPHPTVISVGKKNRSYIKHICTLICPRKMPESRKSLIKELMNEEKTEWVNELLSVLSLVWRTLPESVHLLINFPFPLKLSGLLTSFWSPMTTVNICTMANKLASLWKQKWFHFAIGMWFSN